ncbi:protein PLASTID TRANSCRIPTIONALLY ACTIVE 14 isoform X4 [Cryptomeria japonica]|uniref:protein PLASTID TRANSCRIPTIONALLY ACTIVE 14 isoform X4 n=1 Tax=Cryptomeria japonica TaxID=3369 RepID=UPI0027DAA5A1|nr:protein PLASTID TRANSCRIPTIONALLY ACTIVE 14 isoform X4 [Cryptomeria japonica]
MATILHATPFLDSRFSPKCFTPHPAKIDLFQQRLRIPRHIFPQTKNAGRIMKRVLASAAVSAEKSKSSVQEIPSSELEPVDPDFYAIGLSKHVSIFGVEFKEGPDGIGLYAVRDLPHLRKPRADWDLRLACLLLLAFDTKDSFWQFYGDFLPSVEDSTSLLLATEEELIELQDQNLARNIKHQQERVRNFWKKNWHADVPWKVKRLAHDPERFLWAVSIAQSRCINMTMTIGAKVQESNMLIPYADMINHSFQPKCSFRWRKKDRMLEVLINAGQSIKAGEEMTISYMENCPNDRLMAQYGFSLPVNPWESIEFSGRAKIHLDSFLSAFSIAGLMDELYHNDALSDEDDNFADGAVIAAARTLPTWSEGDLPFLPSMEKKSIDELQEECWKLLGMFPTTVAEDIKKLEAELNDRSKIYGSALKYRIHRKQLILNIIRALPLYMERILF